MSVFTKVRSSYVLHSVFYNCQKNNHLFLQRSFIKKEFLRRASSTSVPVIKLETNLISESHNDNREISNETLQSQLDRYNDKRIIFNSITFKWENYCSFNKKKSRHLLRAEKLFSSESIAYQRLKDTENKKYEKKFEDTHQSGESFNQKSARSDSAACRSVKDSPDISITVEETDFNFKNSEKNNTQMLHPSGALKNLTVINLKESSMESIPAFHKTNCQLEKQYSDKCNQEIVIGSADKRVPISSVICGGCGALQHCQDPALPGFKPYEKFVGLTDDELRLTVCYRCHFLTGFDLAVPTAQSPQSYRELLEPVRSPNSLVLVVVDLTDAPCSIHPDILKIIAFRQPVIIVGSKVDLLPLSGRTCLQRAREALDALIQRTTLAKANILDTCLVSGHTGYGVEDLVSSIFTHWHQKGKFFGDVFLVGCTNSGKSTLYNALLQSDLSDQLADTCSLRATTSTWPATTVDMIKFPMLLWTPWHAHQAGCGDRLPPPAKFLRVQRLKREQEAARDPLGLAASERFTRNPAFATLTGTVGRTNLMDGPPVPTKSSLTAGDSARKVRRKVMEAEEEEVISYNPDGTVFEGYTCCYDTPGLVQPQQFLGLLTQEELRLVLPDQLIVPETFRLHPGMSLFVGGLARLDVLHLHHDDTDGSRKPNSVKVTVFRSRALPVSIVWSVAATSFHRDYLGSSLLRVPMGSDERLRQWPALEPSNITAVGGAHRTEADADVVLSSAGWVSLCLPPGSECQLRAWTPGGRGVFLRAPALLPLAGTKSKPIARGSVVYNRNLLYVAQPKPHAEEAVDSDDVSRTHFPAIADGRNSKDIYLKQSPQRLLVDEIPDQFIISNDQNDKFDDSNLQHGQKFHNS